jgi:hypothetical protein
MATTPGDRYGWSGVESWRNGAPTDSQQLSQDYSQQCSQTSSRDAVEGSARFRQLTATLTGLLTATLTDPGHSPVNGGARSNRRGS